jgi:hypothetical protein
MAEIVPLLIMYPLAQADSYWKVLAFDFAYSNVSIVVVVIVPWS